MKSGIYPCILVLLFLTYCQVADDPENSDLLSSEEKFSIVFEDSIKITNVDMEMYDFSTHLIYMKEDLPFLSEFDTYGSFDVMANGEIIYSGELFPAYYSSMPSGPFITVPQIFYPDYIIAIENRFLPDSLEDIRDDERIENILKQTGLFHPGLNLQIDTILISANNVVQLQFTITNNDSYNYYILSPDKMGLPLFHYFTNGLLLTREGELPLSHQITPVPPESWDSWKPAWTDLLRSGSSNTYTIRYENFDNVAPGSYQVRFTYPGLGHQVEKTNITRLEGRIWLGEITLSENKSFP